MNEIWSKEKSWEWYNAQQWIVGCNYIPSCCINGIEIWQEYGFEHVINVMARELKLAKYTGLNSVRMLLPIEVWKHQHDSFMKRFDLFLDLIDQNGITLIPIFFDDCSRGPIERHTCETIFGKQHDSSPGFHGGYPPAKEQPSADPTYHMADNRDNWPTMKAFVKDMVGTYRDDKRILVWDLWNEPGNSGTGGYGNVNKSIQAMEAAFEWARELSPIQPLTAGPWDFYHDYFERDRFEELTLIERRAVELSDVVSYHYYGNYERSLRLIEAFKTYCRPLFITEWLHRPFENHVHNHLPLYKNERVACYHWGLVNGKTQTHEPWDWIQHMDLDFSQWQHDIYKSNGEPYNPSEIALFRELTKQL